MRQDTPSTDPSVHERRGESRGATIFRPVIIETEEFSDFCLVCNLSPNGMRAKVYTMFAAEQPITVQFSASQFVHGRLAWCDGDHIGVQFELPRARACPGRPPLPASHDSDRVRRLFDLFDALRASASAADVRVGVP